MDIDSVSSDRVRHRDDTSSGDTLLLVPWRLFKRQRCNALGHRDRKPRTLWNALDSDVLATVLAAMSDVAFWQSIRVLSCLWRLTTYDMRLRRARTLSTLAQLCARGDWTGVADALKSRRRPLHYPPSLALTAVSRSAPVHIVASLWPRKKDCCPRLRASAFGYYGEALADALAHRTGCDWQRLAMVHADLVKLRHAAYKPSLADMHKAAKGGSFGVIERGIEVQPFRRGSCFLKPVAFSALDSHYTALALRILEAGSVSPAQLISRAPPKSRARIFFGPHGILQRLPHRATAEAIAASIVACVCRPVCDVSLARRLALARPRAVEHLHALGVLTDDHRLSFDGALFLYSELGVPIPFECARSALEHGLSESLYCASHARLADIGVIYSLACCDTEQSTRLFYLRNLTRMALKSARRDLFAWTVERAKQASEHVHMDDCLIAAVQSKDALVLHDFLEAYPSSATCCACANALPHAICAPVDVIELLRHHHDTHCRVEPARCMLYQNSCNFVSERARPCLKPTTAWFRVATLSAKVAIFRQALATGATEVVVYIAKRCAKHKRLLDAAQSAYFLSHSALAALDCAADVVAALWQLSRTQKTIDIALQAKSLFNEAARQGNIRLALYLCDEARVTGPRCDLDPIRKALAADKVIAARAFYRHGFHLPCCGESCWSEGTQASYCYSELEWIERDADRRSLARAPRKQRA